MTLKRDLFVRLILKWHEKVLPTAESFTEALHQARTAEEQERQLAEMHKREPPQHHAVPSAWSTLPRNEVGGSGSQSVHGSVPLRDKSQVQCFRCHGMGHFFQGLSPEEGTC